MVAQRQLVESVQDSPVLARQHQLVEGIHVQHAAGAASLAPVQRKKISAFWLPSVEPDRGEVTKLIGAATDTNDVSQENLDQIIAIYQRPGANAAGLGEWTAERDRRSKAKVRSEGGLKATLKAMCGDGWAGVEATVTGLVGEARSYEELPVNVLVEVYKTLKPLASPDEESQAAQAPAKAAPARPTPARVAPARGRTVAAQSPEVPAGGKAIAAECQAIVDLLDASIRKEPAADVEEKVTAEKGRATALTLKGLETLTARYGTDFPNAIAAWKTFMLTQQQTAFDILYRANQMTARFIAPDSAAVGGKFKAMVSPRTGGVLTTGTRDMTLDRNVASIGKRTNPATWKGKETRDVKRDTGLYELSATLLKGRDNDAGIFKQLKHYENATALFMPAADMEDHQILAALSADPRATQVVKEVTAVMTRVIRAQASDMGAKYVDHAPASAKGDIEYGRTGRIVRYEGVPGILATPYELEARNTNALQYGKLVEGAVSIVNEIVIDYRKGRESLFPMFAKWDKGKAEWFVVGADGRPTGQKINDTTGVVS